LGERAETAQDSRQEEIRLRAERPGLDPWVLALRRRLPHVLPHELEIPQEHPLEGIRAVGRVGDPLHAIEHQGEIPFEDLMSKPLRPAEVAMGELLDLPHAELLARDGLDEGLNLLVPGAVHAHESLQVHVGVHRERAAEDLLADRRAHLPKEPQAHGHPGLAPRERLGDVRHGQLVEAPQLVDESRLLHYAQARVVRDPKDGDDPRGHVSADRRVGHGAQGELPRAAIALEAVKEDPSALDLHALQRLLDPALGDRGKDPRLLRRIAQPVALVAQIEARKVGLFGHARSPYGGFFGSSLSRRRRYSVLRSRAKLCCLRVRLSISMISARETFLPSIMLVTRRT
jgi:hypothetical protein